MPFGYNCVRNDAMDGYSTGIEMWQTLVVVKGTSKNSPFSGVVDLESG